MGTRKDSVIFASSILETREESVFSTSATVGTRDDSVISALAGIPGTQHLLPDNSDSQVND